MGVSAAAVGWVLAEGMVGGVLAAAEGGVVAEAGGAVAGAPVVGVSGPADGVAEALVKGVAEPGGDLAEAAAVPGVAGDAASEPGPASGPGPGCGSDGVAMSRPSLLGAGHTGAVERRDVAQHPGGRLHDRDRQRGA